MSASAAVAPIAQPSVEAQAVRARIIAEARERVRLDDIARAKDALFAALHPTPCHGHAALACLECDDDAGLSHHLDRFYAAAKAAWTAWAALKRLHSADGDGGAP